MADSFCGYPDKVMKTVRSCEDQIRNSNLEIRNKSKFEAENSKRKFAGSVVPFGISDLFRISRFELVPLEEKMVKRSAGTLLYRQGPKGLEVLLVHPSGNYNRKAPWGIPKGELDGGEDLETAARRETLEETGVEASTLVA